MTDMGERYLNNAVLHLGNADEAVQKCLSSKNQNEMISFLTEERKELRLVIQQLSLHAKYVHKLLVDKLSEN